MKAYKLGNRAKNSNGKLTLKIHIGFTLKLLNQWENEKQNICR
jgi:hypothetical protein